MRHEYISLAAVIGIRDPHWGERPLLLAKLIRKDVDLSVDALLQYLAGYVAKWWLPATILFVDEIPLTATGKIDKLLLRKIYSDNNN